MSLERFDLLIPDDIKQEIEKKAERLAIAPRVLGRMLLVEKVRGDLKKEAVVAHDTITS